MGVRYNLPLVLVLRWFSVYTANAGVCNDRSIAGNESDSKLSCKFFVATVGTINIALVYREILLCFALWSIKLSNTNMQVWAWVLLYMWSGMAKQESYMSLSYLGRAQHRIWKLRLRRRSMIECDVLRSLFLGKDHFLAGWLSFCKMRIWWI